MQISTGETDQLAQLLHNFLARVVAASVKLFKPMTSQKVFVKGNEKMIGTQPTGTLPGIIISAVVHEGLRVEINGKQGHLAVVDEHGKVVASGVEVEDEVEAVAINCYRSFLKGEGHLRTLSKPIWLD